MAIKLLLFKRAINKKVNASNVTAHIFNFGVPDDAVKSYSP